MERARLVIGSLRGIDSDAGEFLGAGFGIVWRGEQA
jgi:hypothetical protein